jgi:hypothetical protein
MGASGRSPSLQQLSQAAAKAAAARNKPVRTWVHDLFQARRWGSGVDAAAAGVCVRRVINGWRLSAEASLCAVLLSVWCVGQVVGAAVGQASTLRAVFLAHSCAPGAGQARERDALPAMRNG